MIGGLKTLSKFDIRGNIVYSIIKLTVKNRSTIKSGSVVDVEVNEEVSIPENCYGAFYLRKKIAKQGVIQVVHTPFKEFWKGKPLVVLKNDNVSDIELLAGDELGELWIFDK